MNNKTKRLIVILVDIAIGVLIELWASNIFPGYGTLFVYLFFFFVIARLVFDWVTPTVEDKFYNLYNRMQWQELEFRFKVNQKVTNKIVEAIQDGDIEEAYKYFDIKKLLQL